MGAFEIGQQVKAKAPSEIIRPGTRGEVVRVFNGWTVVKFGAHWRVSMSDNELEAVKTNDNGGS